MNIPIEVAVNYLWKPHVGGGVDLGCAGMGKDLKLQGGRDMKAGCASIGIGTAKKLLLIFMG